MGAGPAGLSTAIRLVDEGYDVDVHEETNMVGGHMGTNIQAIRNYGADKNILSRLEREGIALKYFNPIFKIIKYSPTYRSDLIFSNDEPIFYTFKRGVDYESVDMQLARQARELGVNILLGKKARIIDVNVVAGGSKFDPVGMGYGALFENSNFDKDTILFFFGSKFVRHGYAYIAPFSKNQVTIAIISFVKSDFPILEKEFDRFIQEDKIVKEKVKMEELINRFSGYGHYNIPNSAIYKHKYFVGGAAGFVDPARGFGLKYAIMSGILAAKAITSEANYDELWRREFGEELIEGFNRRVILNKLSLKDYEKFVGGRKIPIEAYEKIPSPIKQSLLKINGALKLSTWKRQFDYSKIFNL